MILTWDPEVQGDVLVRDEYLPEALTDEETSRGQTLPEVADAARRRAHRDRCRSRRTAVDGFFACYWARPEAYLDPVVRAGISCCALLDQEMVEERMARLADDLASGAWDERHPGLRELPELDVGYRLVSRQLRLTSAWACSGARMHSSPSSTRSSANSPLLSLTECSWPSETTVVFSWFAM